MQFYVKGVALAAGIIAASAVTATAQVPAQTPAAAPVQDAGEVANFYAGLPVPADSPVGKFTKDPAWQNYAKAFDATWDQIEKQQLVKVRSWTSSNVKESRDTLYYFFSGPDFLYANHFFPNAKTYILAGLEPVGRVPTVDPRTVHSLPAVRAALEHSLKLSYFITADMNARMRGQSVNGVLPALYVYMARNGATLKETTLIQVDSDGNVHPAEGFKGRPLASGTKITFTKDGTERTLYYFSTDLSNGGVAASGILKFAEKFGRGNALFKSASYLPHGGGFSTVRDFILKMADVIVQDDTGVPVRNFKPDEWALNPHGVYIGPIPIFGMGPEPAAVQLWHPKNKPPKLDFGIGYRHRGIDSNLLLAIRKDKKA
jgi:hypothetical protein